jgi:hypothetical protein
LRLAHGSETQAQKNGRIVCAVQLAISKHYVLWLIWFKPENWL